MHRTAPPKAVKSKDAKKAVKFQRCHQYSTHTHTHTHTQCIRPPRQKAVESKNAKEFEVPQLHLMACANHEVRCSPLRCLRRFCIGGPAPHVVCLPFLSPIMPHLQNEAEVSERLQRASPALARPPHLEQASLHMPHTTCFPPRLLPW